MAEQPGQFVRMEEGVQPSCFSALYELLSLSQCGVFSLFGGKVHEKEIVDIKSGSIYERMASTLDAAMGIYTGHSEEEAVSQSYLNSAGKHKAIFTFTESIPESPRNLSGGTLVFRSKAVGSSICKTPAGTMPIHSPLILPQVRQTIHIAKRNLLPELSCLQSAKKKTTSHVRPPLAALSREQLAARAKAPSKCYPTAATVTEIENCPSVLVRSGKVAVKRGRDLVSANAPTPAMPIAAAKRKTLPQKEDDKKKMKKLFPSAPVIEPCGSQAGRHFGFADPFDRSTPFFVFADPDYL